MRGRSTVTTRLGLSALALLAVCSPAAAEWYSVPPQGGVPLWGRGKDGAAFMGGIWQNECNAGTTVGDRHILAIWKYNAAWINAQCYSVRQGCPPGSVLDGGGACRRLPGRFGF